MFIRVLRQFCVECTQGPLETSTSVYFGGLSVGMLAIQGVN